MRPVSADRDRGRSPEHPGLGGDQPEGQGCRQGHHADRPSSGLQGLGIEEVANRFLADQGGRGEDQSRLHQAGEGLGLAMAEAMFLVRGRGRIADREEGDGGGQEIEGGIGQGGQKGDRT
jgi:hypothetical protein